MQTGIYTGYSLIKTTTKNTCFQKKGSFSRGRKRAGAHAPFDVYVCTCLAGIVIPGCNDGEETRRERQEDEKTGAKTEHFRQRVQADSMRKKTCFLNIIACKHVLNT